MLTTKDNLFRNLLTYCDAHKINVFDVVPLTFVLDYDKPNYFEEMQKFEQVFEIFNKYSNISDVNTELERIKIDLVDKKMQAVRSFSRYNLNEGCYSGKNVWFLKATRFNRGRGIYVFDTLDKLKLYIAEM